MIPTKSGRATAWLAMLIFGALWVLLVKHLAVHWSVNPQYSFGWLVPVLCAFTAWRRWATRTRPDDARSPTAAWIAAAAALAFFPTWLVVQPNPDWRLVNWALTCEIVVLSLCAIYLMGGKSWAMHFAFPVCFILTAVPWPTGLEVCVIQSLMRIVASTTVELLYWISSVPAIREGNVITIGAGSLGIDDACSGVRSLQATFMASLFLGELYRFNLNRRVLLVGAGALFALLCNIGRAFLLASVAARHGIDAVSKWHDPAGFTILTVCFLGVWVVALVASRGAGTPRDSAEKGMPRALPAPLVAGLAVWFVFAIGATEVWYRAHESPTTARWSFAWPASRRDFRDLEIAEGAAKALQYNEGRAAAWVANDETIWSAFFFRWAPGPSRSRILARAHRPEICLPAGGFKMQADAGTIVIEAGGAAIPFRAYTFERDGHRLDVFFCLWQDRTKATNQPEVRDEWSRVSGLQAVLRGERNLGQQTLEIILSGYPSAKEAEAALRRELPGLIRAG
jgi:exosortase